MIAEVTSCGDASRTPRGSGAASIVELAFPWLLRQKITVPDRAAAYVHRAELVSRAMPTRRKLTVLKASAGFGKTTLLAECCRRLRRDGVPTAWVSLDDQDRGEVLDVYIAAACHVAGLDLSNVSDPNTVNVESERRVELVVRGIQTLGSPFVIAFDELERLTDPASASLLEFLLQRGPSNLHLADDDTVEYRARGTTAHGVSYNGVELSKNIAGGRLYAEIYTTLEAPASGTGTGQPVRLEDSLGSRIGGLTLDEINARRGDGTLDGVPGIFSCDRSGGGSCPAFFGTHFDPTGTDWIFTPTTTTYSPDMDYLSLGLWVYVPNGVRDLLRWEYGVFADGSDPFDNSKLRGVIGSASYRGAAAGVIVEQGEPEEIYWTAETRLTADFGTAGQLGTISGDVRNFTAGGTTIEGNLSVSLDPAPIGGSNNGFFTGSAGYTYRGVTVRDEGRWGGRFFGNGEPDGKPGSVAGTFGVTNRDGESLLGNFGATRQ